MSNTKITVGLLVLVIFSSVIYVSGNEVRIKIYKDNSVLYVYDDASSRPFTWSKVGSEYNSMWDGTTKMNRRPSNITLDYSIEGDMVHVIRRTPYIRGPVIVDTYSFDSTTNKKDKFPIEHTIEIYNGSGYIYQYEVRDLEVDIPTQDALDLSLVWGTPYKIFLPKNTAIEWDNQSYWAKIYTSGIFKARYRPTSDYEKYDVRLTDPTNIDACGTYSTDNDAYTVTGALTGDVGSACVVLSGIDHSTINGGDFKIATDGSDNGIYVTSVTNTSIIDLYGSGDRGMYFTSGNINITMNSSKCELTDGDNQCGSPVFDLLSCTDCKFYNFNVNAVTAACTREPSQMLDLTATRLEITNLTVTGISANYDVDDIIGIASGDSIRFYNANLGSKRPIDNVLNFAGNNHYYEGGGNTLYGCGDNEEVVYITGVNNTIKNTIIEAPSSQDKPMVQFVGTDSTLLDVTVTVPEIDDRCVELTGARSHIINSTIACVTNTGGEILYVGANGVIDNLTIDGTGARINAKYLINFAGTNVTLKNSFINDVSETGGADTIYVSADSQIYNNNITSSVGTQALFRISSTNVNITNNILYQKISNYSVDVVAGRNNTWNGTNRAGTRVIGSGNLGGNAWMNSTDSFYTTCTDSNTDGFCDDIFRFGWNGTDYNQQDDLAYSDEYAPTPPTVTLSTPANNTEIEVKTDVLQMNYTVVFDQPLYNCSLWGNWTGNWIINQTNKTSISSGVLSNWSIINPDYGWSKWNVECCDTADRCRWGESNRTFLYVNATNISYAYPPNNTIYYWDILPHVFNATIYDDVTIPTCDLYLDDVKNTTWTSITSGETITVNLTIPIGNTNPTEHTWYINCTDSTSAVTTTGVRNLNLSWVDGNINFSACLDSFTLPNNGMNLQPDGQNDTGCSWNITNLNSSNINLEMRYTGGFSAENNWDLNTFDELIPGYNDVRNTTWVNSTWNWTRLCMDGVIENKSLRIRTNFNNSADSVNSRMQNESGTKFNTTWGCPETNWIHFNTTKTNYSDANYTGFTISYKLYSGNPVNFRLNITDGFGNSTMSAYTSITSADWKVLSIARGKVELRNITDYYIQLAGTNDSVVLFDTLYMNDMSLRKFNFYVGSGIETDDNLTHAWDFNQNNSNDKIGDANGVIKGANIDWNATGGHNGRGAYYLNGGDSHIYIDDFSLNETYQLTLSFWAKQRVDANNAMFDKNNYVRMGYIGVDNTLRWRIQNGSKTAAINAVINWDNEWHNYVGIINGSHSLLYQDGVRIGSSATFTGYILDNMPNATFGVNYGGINDMNGWLDDFMILNRSLNSSEIKEYYQETRIFYVDPINLTNTYQEVFPVLQPGETKSLKMWFDVFISTLGAVIDLDNLEYTSILDRR